MKNREVQLSATLKDRANRTSRLTISASIGSEIDTPPAPQPFGRELADEYTTGEKIEKLLRLKDHRERNRGEQIDQRKKLETLEAEYITAIEEGKTPSKIEAEIANTQRDLEILARRLSALDSSITTVEAEACCELEEFLVAHHKSERARVEHALEDLRQEYLEHNQPLFEKLVDLELQRKRIESRRWVNSTSVVMSTAAKREEDLVEA